MSVKHNVEIKGRGQNYCYKDVYVLLKYQEHGNKLFISQQQFDTVTVGRVCICLVGLSVYVRWRETWPYTEYNRENTISNEAKL